MSIHNNLLNNLMSKLEGLTSSWRWLDLNSSLIMVLILNLNFKMSFYRKEFNNHNYKPPIYKKILSKVLIIKFLRSNNKLISLR